MGGKSKKSSSPENKQGMRSFLFNKLKILLHNTIMLINIIFVLLLVLSYLSAHTSPQDLWVLSFFGLAYPFLLVANISFIIYWALNKKALFLVSLVALLIGYNHLSNTFQVRFSQKQPARPDNTFTFLSYNVRLFNLWRWIDDPLVKDRIFEFLLGEDPDILCIQEYFVNKEDPYNIKNSFGIA